MAAGYVAFDTLTVAQGVTRTGSAASTTALDGTYYELGEHSVNGLSAVVSVATSDPTVVPQILEVSGRHHSAAIAGHSILIEPYNYTTAAFETMAPHFATMQPRTTDFAYSMLLTSDHHDPATGEMKFRLLHSTTTYQSSHYLAIDSARVLKVESEAVEMGVLQNLTALAQDIDLEVDTIHGIVTDPTYGNAALKALIDAITTSGAVDGVTITQATLDTDGAALGRVMPYGSITASLAGVDQYRFDADADGDFSYALPVGSVWTLTARASGYRTTIATVSTIPAVS